VSTLELEPIPSPTDAEPPGPPEPPTPDGPPRQPRRGIAAAAALVLVGAVAGGVGANQLFTPGSTATTASTGVQPQQVQPAPPIQQSQPFGGTSGTSADGPTNAASIASKVSPAIVDINTTLGYQGGQAAGTGMVLTSTGEILTNNHVISGATSISVTDVGNGKTYTATVVGYDKSDDIAVLQLHGATGLATVTTASSAAQSGDGVVGIGNAGGAGGTPSFAAGDITATSQTITASDGSDGTSEQLTGLLETDAAIVAGDSGGPLVNTSGQVVGMDTAASAGFRFSQTSQAYAIPIAAALQIAQQIEAGQASSTVHIGATAMLGVGIQPYSTTGDGSSTSSGGQGAAVAQVLRGGPAAKAGISAGDTITAVAGQPITSAADLSRAVLQQQPGSTVTVRYLNAAGASHTATVHLTNGPPQ
jgi:S1-C subfamily serine protease